VPSRTSLRLREETDLDACVRVLATVHENDGHPVNRPDESAERLSPPSALTAWVAQFDGRIA